MVLGRRPLRTSSDTRMISVFAEAGIMQQLLFACFNGVFLTVHAWKRPYVSSLANGIETLSLFLLLCIGILNLPKTLIDAAPHL